MIYAGKKEDSRTSAILAIIIHGVIFLLIFLFLSFDIPDPPPAETYAELSMADFGYSNTGSGNTEGVPTAKAEPSETTPEEAITDDNSETSAPVDNKPSESTQPTTSQTQQQEQQKEEPKTNPALDNLLNNMNNGGDGNTNDQGNTGTQSGKIDGKGVFGNGKGSYSLDGRGMVGEPSFSEKPKKAGKVTVNIYVNKSGVVYKTTINTSGTNTTDAELRALAQRMAKTAKFNADPSANTTQRGTITFEFKVQ